MGKFYWILPTLFIILSLTGCYNENKGQNLYANEHITRCSDIFIGSPIKKADGEYELTERFDVDNNKIWKIAFYTDMMAEDLNSQNIFVVDKNQSVISTSIEITENGKVVYVKPAVSYADGEKYCLKLLKNIRNRSNQSICLNFLMYFNIKQNPAPATTISSSYKLSQSISGLQIWTDFPSERVLKEASVPVTIGNGISLNLAKNEVEPFQIILKPDTSQNVKISLENSISGINIELFQVKYINLATATDNLGHTGYYPDPLYPVEYNTDISLEGGKNNPFWFNVSADKGLAAGDYEVRVIINGITIPVKIHVFNFSIPDNLNVDSQMNFSHQAILTKYGVTGTGDNYWKYVDSMKQFFIKHRLTPSGPLWSGGLTSSGGAPYINYDSTTGLFNDPHGIWGFEYPANRYLNGVGFNNGIGFPSFMAVNFQNNDASLDQRPATFSGTTRSTADWYTANNPNTEYNIKWFKYMADMQKYLENKGYLDKAYYYFANEPQDQADYDAVAWYSGLLKKAAPKLKLMVSEEPKPEIFNNPNYVKIDKWLPVLNNYNPDISWNREVNNGEDSWIYFLHGTRPPYFNPITLDHDGIESKLTGWFLWKYRIKGIAYYAINDWSKNPWTMPMTDGHNGDTFMLYPPDINNGNIAYGSTNHRFVSSIRFELMRDSLEDYEYLYRLNNNQKPVPYMANNGDTEADKIIYGLTSYNRSSEYMYKLRMYMGMKIAGEISAIPAIDLSTMHPRSKGLPSNYYINFQDPQGEPKVSPLIVNGKEYMKIGWTPYNATSGYGWYGDMAHIKSQYISTAPNVLQGSILYDDWGREKTFEFDLPNGKYNVTVSCGWQGKSYARNKVFIEGVPFINDEKTNPYIVRTKQIEIKDYKLTMEMGIFNEYTMINYLEIEAVK